MCTSHVCKLLCPRLGRPIAHGAGDLEDDREILSLLYNTTGGADWINNDGWGSDDMSLWFGVTVNDTSSAVEELNLIQNNLRGAERRRMVFLLLLHSFVCPSATLLHAVVVSEVVTRNVFVGVCLWYALVVLSIFWFDNDDDGGGGGAFFCLGSAPKVSGG